MHNEYKKIFHKEYKILKVVRSSGCFWCSFGSGDRKTMRHSQFFCLHNMRTQYTVFCKNSKIAHCFEVPAPVRKMMRLHEVPGFVSCYATLIFSPDKNISSPTRNKKEFQSLHNLWWASLRDVVTALQITSSYLFVWFKTITRYKIALSVVTK
jgi:hypothetical protein